MSGINPYIEKQEFELPKVNYRITFLPMGKNVEVLFDEIPEEGDGLPGSILKTRCRLGLTWIIHAVVFVHAQPVM